MVQNRHKPQIVAKLRKVDVLGRSVRSIGVTHFTYNRWRKEFGGLKTDEVKRLKKLKKENDRLRNGVAEKVVLTVDFSSER